MTLPPSPIARAAVTVPLLLALAGAAHAEPESDPPAEDLLRELRSEREALEAERRALQHELRRTREELERQRHTLAAERDEATTDRVGYGEVVRVAAGEDVADVVGFGADVHVDGHVRGDAASFGGDIVISPTGAVDGDATAFGGRVVVLDGGRIGGDRVTVDLPGVAVLPEQPAATGSLTNMLDLETLGATLYRHLVAMLSFAGAGVLVVGLFPTRVSRIAESLEHRPVRAAVVGAFTTTFIAVFSLLFAVVTLGLGLPVSFVLVALLGLAWLLGFVGLCQAVGDRLPFERKPHGRWVAFLVGAVLLTFVGTLPMIGHLVVLAASIVGVGAATMTRLGGR